MSCTSFDGLYSRLEARSGVGVGVNANVPLRINHHGRDQAVTPPGSGVEYAQRVVVQHRAQLLHDAHEKRRPLIGALGVFA
jgi:hypothetical protein